MCAGPGDTTVPMMISLQQDARIDLIDGKAALAYDCMKHQARILPLCASLVAREHRAFCTAPSNSFSLSVNPIDPAELARISAALVKRMAEARVLHDTTGVDEAFRENIREARELHDLLLKGLIEAEPGPTEYLRGLCDSMGNNLDELEGLVRRSLS